LNGVKAVLAAFRQDAHAIDHRIRTLDCGAHAVVIAQIGKDRLDLTDSAIRAHEKRLVRAPHRHPHPPALLGHAACDVSADKSRTAENGDELRHG
jgi:hypothetical protein